ncbi:MAG: tRNA threonylcarbamoyladenosine biosynthesis protein RimN [Porticoccaceae bacterium]|jgi:L-threonylcarbamoyladenylate synthase|nr:tRNA threonylcarbamoyladenosine biosynthesis protein RimN [Porticoccaceae bacterium]
MSEALSIYSSAALALKQGAVIAYPTEGVWGLGCDPLNPAAVRKVLELKSRSEDKGLILVGSEINHFSAYTKTLDAEALSKIEASAGQALTWLIEHGGSAPDWISGGKASLAIRLSDHPAVVGLCTAFAGPIVSTSANPSGEEPALNSAEVGSYFGNLIDIIVPGDTGGQNGATEIRELKTGRILRPGAQSALKENR